MNWTMKWTCKLWKSINWKNETMKKYELKKWIRLWIDVWNDYEMTMKWLWNDYKFIYEFWYEMNYETTYEIMIWIDYELSDSSMKKYELMYEKVFFNKLIIWKCMKKYFSTSS